MHPASLGSTLSIFSWRQVLFFDECQMSCVRLDYDYTRQQTAVINAIRAHLAEFGFVAPVGRHGVEQLLGVVVSGTGSPKRANMRPFGGF
jgi:hypothetical protein